jgi:hypothetical protein
MNERDLSPSVASTLERVDRAWHDFHAAITGFPAERMNERLGGGWTRKQMLAHIAAWHDLTSDRLAAFMKDGEVQALADHENLVNARVARKAEGRTMGEIFDALQTSFRRLRRQVSHLTDQQLAAHDGWPAAIVAGNTYEHYDEHLPDLEVAGDRDGHAYHHPRD